MDALREVLLHRQREQHKADYAAHLLWLLGAQLYALSGGQDYPVPGISALFPDDAAPRDRRSAADIQQSILNQLTRKEPSHGKAL